MPAVDRQQGVGGERKLPAQFNLRNQHSIVFLYITNCMFVSTSYNTILRCILYKDFKYTLINSCATNQYTSQHCGMEYMQLLAIISVGRAFINKFRMA